MQTSISHGEGPRLGLGAGPVLGLYPSFTPVVPGSGQIASWTGRIVPWTPVLYGCWAVMQYQILATYPNTTFVPVASYTPCLMYFCAPLLFTYRPW